MEWTRAVLSDSNKEVENIIIRILHNNNYDVSIPERLGKTEQKLQEVKHNTNKWAKFTYVIKERWCIIKLFYDSSMKVTYTTNNTISKALAPKRNFAQKRNQFQESGVYQLTSPDCNMRYIGQTGRAIPGAFPRTLPEL